MALKGVLNRGWHLFKPRADAGVRRAVLEAAAQRFNGSAELPPGLGPFSVAPCRGDMDPDRSYGQIRATSSGDPSAFELRCIIRQDPKPDAYTSKADRDDDDARDMREAIKDAREHVKADMSPLAAEVRRVVAEAIAPTMGSTDPVQLIAIGGSGNPFGGMYVSVDLETVGHDLRPGVDRCSGVLGERLSGDLDACVTEHVRLESLRREALAAGIPGWIDGAAVRILGSSGLGLGRLFDLLTRNTLVEMSGAIEGRPRQRVALRWLSGVISGVVGEGRDDAHYDRGLLSIRDPHLPETLLMALPGRPLGNLVEQPLIPPHPIIKRLFERNGRLQVEVDETVIPITPAMMQIPAISQRPPGAPPAKRRSARRDC